MGSTTVRYFIQKFRNRLAVKKNCIWKHCNVERLSHCGYNPFRNAADFKERLHVMLGAFSRNTMEGVTDIERQTIIDCAEQTLRHEFDLLGSGPVSLNPIDWHKDFKSGKKWDKLFYRDITRTARADIKVPWELSRCQHLLWLGEAYLLTEDKRYAQEIIDEIGWWIQDNPLMYSVNWTCSMDVAFRAVNWMFALNMIAGYEGVDDAFAKKVSSSLWQHGFFISNNLEKQIPYSNNHYASDVVGLLYIGSLFQHTRKGKKWFRFALNEYYAETRQQVLLSGVHYERSVSYHRLMTELLSYPVYMLKRIGVSIPSDVMNLIQGMYAFVANYTKPNGFAPLIADNDDGRFVPFYRRDFREHNYLNDELSIENRFVSCDENVLFHSDERKNMVYSDAGFAIMRKGGSYLFISNGGYSKKPNESDITIGTHTHNDLLSFELSIKNSDFIIDPGSYLYTPDPVKRNEFRSTKKHNTIIVDGEEQNDLSSRSMFSVKRNVHIDKLENLLDGVKGSYKTIKGGLKHERRFDLTDGLLEISDYLHKVGLDHKANIYFHLSDGIRACIQNGDCVVVECTNRYVSFRWTASYIKGDIRLHIDDDFYSPSYGILKKSKCLIIGFDFDDYCIIKTSIEWTKK